MWGGKRIRLIDSCHPCAGFVVLELVVAAVVLAVGVIGLTCAISSSTVVNAVTQENNLARNAAHEVIERLKSEGFTALKERIQADVAGETPVPPEPGEPPDDDEPPTGPGNGRNRRNRRRGQPDPGSRPDSSSWYPTSAGRQDAGIAIDADGNFAITGLTPWDDDPDGKVGKVTLALIDNDRVDISVAVRWQGRCGKTEKALRCRIPELQRFTVR